MSNEDFAKELLKVLKERMWYREGLPSDGWAVEKICQCLEAAKQAGAVDVCQCVREDYFELTEPDGSKSCSGCGKSR